VRGKGHGAGVEGWVLNDNSTSIQQYSTLINNSSLIKTNLFAQQMMHTVPRWRRLPCEVWPPNQVSSTPHHLHPSILSAHQKLIAHPHLIAQRKPLASE